MSPSITLSHSFDIVAMRDGGWMVILKACLMAWHSLGPWELSDSQDDKFLKEDQKTIQKYPLALPVMGEGSLSPILLASPLLSAVAQVGLLKQEGFLAAQISNPDQLREVLICSHWVIAKAPLSGQGETSRTTPCCPLTLQYIPAAGFPKTFPCHLMPSFGFLPCALGKVL